MKCSLHTHLENTTGFYFAKSYIFHWQLPGSERKSGIIIINSLKKKRQKDRVHSFPNGNKMIERTSSGPLRLASKSDKIKKDKTLLPRCWGAISKNLEGDSKTYGQSMDFQSIHEIRYKMRPALRDQHEGSRLAYECRTPGKSRAKIKAHLLSEEEILHDIS